MYFIYGCNSVYNYAAFSLMAHSSVIGAFRRMHMVLAVTCFRFVKFHVISGWIILSNTLYHVLIYCF